jgi:hypothetical protein
MHTPLLLRRAAGSLFPLATGLLALACGGGSGGDTTIIPQDPPKGSYTSDIEVALAYGDEPSCGLPPAPKLHLVSSLTFQDTLAAGWVALSRMDPSNSGVPVSMAGSESLVGQVEGGVVAFDPIQFSTGSQSWQFDELELRFGEGGKIDGTAKGNYQVVGGDVICPVSFTATLTGGPDATPPSAALEKPDPAIHLPYDSIAIAIDEPVKTAATTAGVKAGGMVVPAKLLSQADKYPGLARALSLSPLDADWPAGASLSLSLGSLTDAAGHASDIDLGTIKIAPAQDAWNNLGFENGLSPWLSDPPQYVELLPSIQATDDGGAQVQVSPPQGSFFASVTHGTRLAGYLVPPSGTKKLHLRAAVVMFLPFGKGQLAQSLSIQLFAKGARFASFDGTNLPAPDSPMSPATWTGWTELTVDLPAEASSGFWIQVTPGDFISFIGPSPRALIDALVFE